MVSYSEDVMLSIQSNVSTNVPLYHYSKQES